MIQPIARPYRSTDAAAWNAFNAAAHTGHFLFDRRFLEYHADRFTDASLLVEEAGVIRGLLAANRVGTTVYSHQGLTFGGLVTRDTSTSAIMWRLDAIAACLLQQGATRMVYKALPATYHCQPAASDLYWLFRRGAVLTRRDLTTTIDYRQPGWLSSRRLRGVKKAAKAGLTMGPSDNLEGFWNLLAVVLRGRHKVAPVHTLAELTLLIGRLPQNIRLYTAVHDDEIVAGVLIFETKTVAHAQYIAASELGRDLGALDGLFDLLIRQYADSKRFFDFGISTEGCGRLLNEGLIKQKEEFGGGGALHDVYELDLSR
jgi:hypothetical protein